MILGDESFRRPRPLSLLECFLIYHRVSTMQFPLLGVWGRPNKIVLKQKA